jgi:PAS domain S-box-containing protein
MEHKKGYKRITMDSKFYQTLLDSITDAVFVLNRKWEYILVNQKAAVLVKMTKEQLLGKEITNLFPGIEQTKFFKGYARVMKNQNFERIVEEFIHPDGRKGYYEVDVYHINEGILCISRDITESKTIEAELLKEKLFTETALNSQQDTLFIFEISTGKALRWNKSFRDISGYSDQEISEMKAPDSYYSEEDLKKAERTIGLALNEGAANVEISLITKSRQKIPFEYYTSIMKDPEDNPKYMISIGRDISERKQVEDKLRENEFYLTSAQEMSHIGHWKLNPITSEVHGSDELFKIFSLNHDEASLETFVEVVHPDDREYDVYHIQRGMETGESWDIEHRLILRDGTEKWVHAIGEATKDETGKVILLLGTVQDITERKKVEEVLYHERDLIRTLLENHPDFIYFKDREGRFQHISNRFSELFGRKMEDIVGKTDLELFPEEEAKRSYDEDLEVIKTGTPLINKEEHAADTWVLTTKLPWFDKDGNIKGLFGISHDITERKKVEEEIRESEEKYRNISKQYVMLLESITDAVYAINREWEYILVNKNAEEIINMPIEKLIGYKIFDVFPGIEQTVFFKTYKNVMSTGNAERVINSFTLPDGNIGYYDVSVYPINEGILCIGRNVTEEKNIEQNLKESEEKFRNITEQSLMGIAILQDNVIKYASQRLAEIYGYSVEEMLNFEPGGFLRLIHPDFVEVVKDQAMKKQSGLKDAITHYQVKCVKKTGEIFWVENHSKTINFNGRPADLVTNIDITERKKAEEELKKSEENYRNAFERAELYKDLFAHDISNILQNIRSSVGLFSVLRNRPDQLEKLDEVMEIINDQIIRGSKLVSNIRKLSQVSESETILEKVNVNTELKEAVKFIRESFPNKNLDIKIESKLQDVHVKANSLLLDVFENILFNAVKYADNSAIKILIRISEELKNETKYFKIEFKDNGMGISDTMKERIFEGSTTPKRTKGMGLGLLLVKRILDRYNGEIWVEDNIKGDSSQGSNFVLLIPEEVD